MDSDRKNLIGVFAMFLFVVVALIALNAKSIVEWNNIRLKRNVTKAILKETATRMVVYKETKKQSFIPVNGKVVVEPGGGYTITGLGLEIPPGAPYSYMLIAWEDSFQVQATIYYNNFPSIAIEIWEINNSWELRCVAKSTKTETNEAKIVKSMMNLICSKQDAYIDSFGTYFPSFGNFTVRPGECIPPLKIGVLYNGGIYTYILTGGGDGFSVRAEPMDGESNLGSWQVDQTGILTYTSGEL